MLSPKHQDMERNKWWSEHEYAKPFTEEEYIEYRTYTAQWPMYHHRNIVDEHPPLIAYIEQLRAALKALKDNSTC